MIRINLLYKTCTRCGSEKQLKKYRLQLDGKYGRHATCRLCSKLYDVNRYSENPEKCNKATVVSRNKNPLTHRDSSKKYYQRTKHDSEKYWKQRIRYKYGLAAWEYAKMLSDQNGVCDICKKPPKLGKRLSIDHNHVNNRVRALLCGNCNSILGLCHEKADILTNAIKYLQIHGETDSDYDLDNLKRKLEACGIQPFR
jgi:hypothetical protein